MSDRASGRGVVWAARRAGGSALRVDLTPMIDVILILVVFWMAVTSWSRATGEPAVRLPVAEQTDGLVLPKGLLVISLLRETEGVFIDGRERTLKTLSTALVEGLPPRRALVRADGSVPAQRVAEVLSALRSGGVGHVAVAARRGEGAP